MNGRCAASPRFSKCWKKLHGQERTGNVSEYPQFQNEGSAEAVATLPGQNKRRLSRDTPPSGNFECGSFARKAFPRPVVDALTRAVVLPAVIHTANAVSFHPSGGKLGSTVSASKSNHMWCSSFAAIKGEVLTHDPDGFCMRRRKILRTINRLPKKSHVAAGECLGSDVDEVLVTSCRAEASVLFRCGHDYLFCPIVNAPLGLFI